MTKSNICIASNIYIRSDSNIRRDKKYTEKITGAKRLKEIRESFTGFNTIPFTEIQEKIVSESQHCAYAKSGEMSFGAVMKDGVLRWENRCEYTKCPGIGGCTPRVIPRETVSEDKTEEKESLQKFIESLGNFEKKRKATEPEEITEEYPAPAEETAEEIQKFSKEYIEITEPDRIITAPIDSHIILNSGPGTGKTYTIIQRLIYILANNLCPADEIYILCYTRSAKQIVESKIDSAVKEGTIPPSAKNICVMTFDSYATYFLMAMKEQGVISENFENYDYNGRIKLFNKYITAEDFESISYFVVDEIQDLVNDRAEMVLKILANLKCGYLLAGDRCQSIYDFEAEKDVTLDSVEFYKRFEEQSPEDMQRYEITANRRQITELAEEASKMRRVLLNESFAEQNKYAESVMEKYLGETKIEDYIKSMTAPTVSTAILCRYNSEAEYISGLLCKRKIAHVLNRGVNSVRPLPRWIADVFWDYCRDTISKNVFAERLNFRTDKQNSEELWEILCALSKSQDKVTINIPDLISAFSNQNDIPDEFYDELPKLSVSTIHKAKGSEFDEVILVHSDLKISEESAEEARVRYVALTRPRISFTARKKINIYFQKLKSKRQQVRLIQIDNYHKAVGIVAGLSGDIDSRSFVTGDFDAVLDLQEYIACNVKLYDKLTAERSPVNGNYELFHEGRKIGCLSRQMKADILSNASSSRPPVRLENLYVSGVTAEILKQFGENIPTEYQKSKICFGVQVTGLAKLKFEKK